MKGFKAYQIDTTTDALAASTRRDLHTVCLLTGPSQTQCADQVIEREDTYLLVDHLPEVKASEWAATPQKGYGCLFTEEFVQEKDQAGSQPSWALFTGNHPRVFPLCDGQAAYLTGLFQKMLAEQQSEYCFKHELLRSYLQLVLHEALRLRKPAPKRRFRYYFLRPGPAGVLGSGWGSRRRV
jgi:AraC family transcriptional activator of pobA